MKNLGESLIENKELDGIKNRTAITASIPALGNESKVHENNNNNNDNCKLFYYYYYINESNDPNRSVNNASSTILLPQTTPSPSPTALSPNQDQFSAIHDLQVCFFLFIFLFIWVIKLHK